MGKLIEPHSMFEWHTLLCEAKSRTGYECDENLESYLILTLDKFLRDNSLESSPLALEFLQRFELSQSSAREHLRSLGDRCLMLAGLFPNRAEKLNVSNKYFASIGQEAYQALSVQMRKNNNAELFYLLSVEFNPLSELLNAMRGMPLGETLQ